MVAVTYIEHDGTRHVLDLEEGTSLMEGATLNMVPGVEGMCGGICSCATCHCYLPPEWADRVPPPSLGEQHMLESASHRRVNSRLGCQVVITADLEGLVVELPPEQGC